MHGEAKIAAEVVQARDISLRIVAEAEGFAFMQLDRMQPVAQDDLCEAARGPLTQLIGEGKDQRQVESAGGEQFELDGKWSDQRKASAAVQHMRRMRIEGNGH